MIFAIHWHESAMDLHVLPIPIPPATSLPIPFLWVFPVYQPWALVSCIQSGLAICFTLDSILVSMLFSQNIQLLSLVRLLQPHDCCSPSPSVHGIFQTRILEWVAFSSSRGFSQPRDWICVTCIAGGFLHCRWISLLLSNQGSHSNNNDSENGWKPRIVFCSTIQRENIWISNILNKYFI